MHRPNLALKKPRPINERYLWPKIVITKKPEQLPLTFNEWEEVREPRAFGPPGRRAFR